MKRESVFFIFVVLFFNFSICFGQEKTKAVLVEKMSGATSGCEEHQGKVESLYGRLLEDPDALGYIIIYGDKNDAYRKYYEEDRIKQIFRLRWYSLDRVTILRGGDLNTNQTEFWVAPKGADGPDYEQGIWDFKLPAQPKSLLVREFQTVDFDYPCYRQPSTNLYTQFLLANPHLEGQIIIYDDSIGNFRRKVKELTKTLADDFKILKNRLKFINKKSKYHKSVGKYQAEEYWLAPKTKK